MVDLEITTHVRCLEEDLPALLQRYVKMLQAAGFSTQGLEERLASITWEPDGSGFGFLGNPLTDDLTTLSGESLAVRPYVLGYTDATIEELETPWVQLSLVFEGHMVELMMNSVSGKMRAGANTIIWETAQQFSGEFHESGVFFNDSPTVNEPWYSLSGREGDLWAFDLALIPTQLAPQFWPVPEGYAYIHLSETLGLARLISWEVVPWTDGHG